MQKLLYTFLALLQLAMLEASEPDTIGPARRSSLMNLERAGVVEGTRAGQIGLTNARGDQKYSQYVEINPTQIGYTPTATGNPSANHSEFVIAPDSTVWYIDWQGRGLQLAGAGGGSEACDLDWLQISDNSCPDAITDSIYHYKYAAIGARLVWPGGEFLVADSLLMALQVISGKRNARIALYDNHNGTWSSIDQGGSETTWYLQQMGGLTVKAAAGGTPQAPTGNVNHFGVNVADSTIQMHRYGSGRVADTASITNVAYWDQNGVMRKRPKADLSGLAPGGAASGDLNGTYPSPTVDGLQGRPVASTAPNSGEVLKWDGTTWVPATDGGGSSIDTLLLGSPAVGVTDTAYFFGTSITAGSDASVTAKNYVSLVASGLNVFGVNGGLGGYCLQKPTGFGGSSFMNTYTSSIPTKTASRKYLFLAWGENDSYFEQLGATGFDTTQFKTDYQTVINYAISTKGWTAADIRIISPFYQLTTRATLARQQKYYAAAQTVAVSNNIQYINVFSGGQTLGQAGLQDDVHPSDVGMATAAHTILSAMPNPVEDRGQLLAVNGVTETKSLIIRDLDEAATGAAVGAINPDGTVAKFPQDRFLQFFPSEPAKRQTGNVYVRGAAEFSTYGNFGTALRIQGQPTFTSGAGFEIYSNGTDGFLFPYNRTTSSAGNVFITQGKLGVATSSLPASATGATLYAAGAIQGTNGIFTAGFNPPNVPATMVGIFGGNGYIWAYNNGTSIPLALNALGGNVMVGTNTDVAGIKLNVIGAGAFSTKLKVGATATATALLDLAPGTATANTAPLKLNTGTNLTSPEPGAIEYDGTEFYATPSSANRHILARVLKGSATLDFPSTAIGASSTLTITVTGAADGDPVCLGVPNASTVASCFYDAWVSATNTVTVQFTNPTGSAQDPASGTFKVTVNK